MKTRLLLMTAIALALPLLLLSGQPAQAQIRSEARSGLAVDNVVTALSDGYPGCAVAEFAEGAVVIDRVEEETYHGRDEIQHLLADWYSVGRRFHVDVKDVTKVAGGTELVRADVIITHRPQIRSQKSIMLMLHEGDIQRLDITDVQVAP